MHYYQLITNFIISYLIVKLSFFIMNVFQLDGINMYTLKPFGYEYGLIDPVYDKSYELMCYKTENIERLL